MAPAVQGPLVFAGSEDGKVYAHYYGRNGHRVVQARDGAEALDAARSACRLRVPEDVSVIGVAAEMEERLGFVSRAPRWATKVLVL